MKIMTTYSAVAWWVNYEHTCGNLSSLPANWIKSQPKLRICSSASSLRPSLADGVGLRRSRGITELEMSSWMAPNVGAGVEMVVMLRKGVGTKSERLDWMFGR